MSKPTVGLTGGIASGKSTVADLFVELGVPLVDADAIAREVVEPGSEGLAEVVDTFGEQVLGSDGTLDRQKLGDIVFEDPGARAKLNAITHPRIARRSTERMAELQQRDAPYVMYEAALLVENGIHRGFDALVVVAASEQTQLQRLLARDELTEDAARARIAAQLPLDRKTEAADHVIWNDGSVDELRGRVQEVHEALLNTFGATGGAT